MTKEIKLKKYDVHVFFMEGDLSVIKVKAKNKAEAKKIIRKKYGKKNISIKDVYDYPSYEQY